MVRLIVSIMTSYIDVPDGVPDNVLGGILDARDLLILLPLSIFGEKKGSKLKSGKVLHTSFSCFENCRNKRWTKIRKCGLCIVMSPLSASP